MTSKKIWAALSMAAVAICLSVGCSKPETERAENRAEALKRETADALETAKEKSLEAWDAVKDATWDRRDQYQGAAKEQASAIGEELEEMGAKIREKSGEGSEEIKQRWERLANERAVLERQIDRLGDATESGWNQSRDAVRDSFSKLRNEMKELKNKIG